MLDNFRNTINNLKAFDFEREQEAIVEANKEVLADLQAEQFAQSRDRNNKPIQLLDNPGGGYRPFTIQQKLKYGIGLGRVTSRITLFQTGALYKELFASIKNGQFFIESSVPYFTELIKRTGEETTGLSEEERRRFAETYTLPGMKKALKEKTNLEIK